MTALSFLLFHSYLILFVCNSSILTSSWSVLSLDTTVPCGISPLAALLNLLVVKVIWGSLVYGI